MDRKLATALFCSVFALLSLGSGTSPAAFPGEPGPVVYRKTIKIEVVKGERTTAGGLFLQAPRPGAVPRQLTFEPSDERPSVSPDGRKIVFEGRVNRHRFGPGIYVINSDGSGRRLLTDDGFQASFFPDSRRIVFSRATGNSVSIFTIRLDGTGLRRITHGRYGDYDATVSPDGKTIAFSSERDQEGKRDHSDIFTVPSSGGRPRLLIDGPNGDEDPNYSPDGRQISFASSRRSSTGIFVANSDGRQIERLTPCKPSLFCPSYSHPAFSPDGKQIVALGHVNSLSLIRSDGGGIVGTIDRGQDMEEGLKINLGIPTWGVRLR